MGGLQVYASDLIEPDVCPGETMERVLAVHGSAAGLDPENCRVENSKLQLTHAGILTLAEQFWADMHVSEDKIRDKSKANGLQKILVLLQVTWMATSCTVRLVYGLSLTLLEIHTLVHVVCAMSMFLSWFKVYISQTLSPLIHDLYV